jgi:pentatricopeptide repeat protein
LIVFAAQTRQYHRVIKIFQVYSKPADQSEGSHIPKQKDAAVTTPILNCFLTALLYLGRMQEFEEALGLFDPLANKLPNRHTYAILLRAYIQSLNLRKARLLFIDIFNRGMKIDSRILRTVICGEGELAVSLESIDCLLSLFFSEDFELRDMKCYNLIIDAYLRRDRPEKARAVLDKITSKGLQPDGGTFDALMRYQARKEGSAGVKAILSSMAKSGVTPALNHLNILISTLTRETPIDLFSTNAIVASHGLVSDIVTANIVLRALLRQKFDSEILQEHFSEMQKLGLQPDAHTFTILLNEYKKKKGSWKRAQEVLLRQATLNPQNVNRITKNVLIHHMISQFSKSSSNTPINTEFNATLHDENRLLVQWDLRTLTSLIVSYSRCREWSRIVDLYQKVRNRAVKLDRQFYRILVEALLQGRRYKTCLEAVSNLNRSDDILDRLFARECKIRVSRTIYKTTRRGKSALMQDIDEFLKYADEKGIMITEKHCNLIAVTFLDIQKAHLSIQLLESRYHGRGRFQEIDNAGALGMSSWTILMRAYARSGADGISNIRSCIRRSTASLSTRPSRAFLNFIQHLGQNEELRRAKPDDCSFFMGIHRMFTNGNRRSSAFPSKGRETLTKTNIIMWINGLEEKDDNGSLKNVRRQPADAGVHDI